KLREVGDPGNPVNPDPAVRSARLRVDARVGHGVPVTALDHFDIAAGDDSAPAKACGHPVEADTAAVGTGGQPRGIRERAALCLGLGQGAGPVLAVVQVRVDPENPVRQAYPDVRLGAFLDPAGHVLLGHVF